jgi:hypothetical protein
MEHPLLTITFYNISSGDDLKKHTLEMIEYYLVINRVNRDTLMAIDVPVGIWAHALAKVCDEPDGIYYVLCENPEILTHIIN